MEMRCATVVADEVEISTPRQLAALLGSEDLLVWNHHEGHMDWCLCAVNLATSLRTAGMTWRADNGKLLIERTP